MKKSLLTMVPALAIAMCPIGIAAGILEVGPDRTYTRIADALSVATDTDEIIVDGGEYEIEATLSIVNAVHLHSRDGRSATTLRPASGVTARLVDVRNANARVSGLTISGGNQSLGVNVDSGLIDDCVIENCIGGSGAGAYVGANGVISNCIVRGNAANVKTSLGGGAYVAGRMTDCVVSNNQQRDTYYGSGGGGLCLAGAGSCLRTVIAGNAINSSGSAATGAGVYFNTSGLLADCLIVGNSGVNVRAAGVTVNQNAAGTVLNCTIARNTVGVGQPDYVKKYSTAKFVNCLIQENTTDFSSALDAYCGKMTFANCSSSSAYPQFLENAPVASWVETDVFADSGNGDYSLVGCHAVEGGDDALYLAKMGVADFGNSRDIAGNDRKSGDSIDIGAYEKPISSGLDASLLLGAGRALLGDVVVATVRAVGPGVENATYRIDWGDGTGDGYQSSNVFSHAYAILGAKTVAAYVKRGAEVFGPFEAGHVVVPAVVYVAPASSGATPTAPYIQPETATPSLAEALAAVCDGAEVRVLPGTYELGESVAVADGVHIRAMGNREETVFRADPEMTERLLIVRNASARVSGLTLSGENRSLGVNVDSGLIDDCIVENCIGGSGAGVYVGAHGVISNCIVRCNAANVRTSLGGGAYVAGRMTDCVVSNNQQRHTYYGSGGGGLCLAGGGSCLRTVIADNAINSSGSSATGAGVLFYTSGLLADCLIVGNSGVNVRAAGVTVPEGVAGTVLNCTIAHNAVGIGQPNFVSAYSTAKFVNCLIQENATDFSSALDAYCGKMTFANCSSSSAYPQFLENAPVASWVETGVLYNKPPSPYSLKGGHARNGGDDALYLAALGRTSFAGCVDLAGNQRKIRNAIDIGCLESAKQLGSVIILH